MVHSCLDGRRAGGKSAGATRSTSIKVYAERGADLKYTPDKGIRRRLHWSAEIKLGEPVAMHELSIARNIVEIVLDEMAKHGLNRVDAVRLKIGAMAQVLPDALRFGFNCLSDQTPLAGASLVIEEVAARGSCRQCGHEFDMGDWTCLCPVCKGTDIDIVAGREMDIVEIEGESA